MKLKNTNISRFFPIIIIPTGWAALGFTLFSKPGLVSALGIFTTSAQGALRKTGVMGVFLLALLVILVLTLYWIDLIFISGKYFSFISPLRKFKNKQPAKRIWLVVLLILSLLFLQLFLNQTG